MKFVCPHCNKTIEVDTYYSRHRKELLKKYHDNMQNPEFQQRRREIALKSYHKNKGK